jgi:uncharacterized protein YjbI with pentapeptide repeats
VFINLNIEGSNVLMHIIFQFSILKKANLSIPDYFQKAKNFYDILFVIG